MNSVVIPSLYSNSEFSSKWNFWQKRFRPNWTGGQFLSSMQISNTPFNLIALIFLYHEDQIFFLTRLPFCMYLFMRANWQNMKQKLKFNTHKQFLKIKSFINLTRILNNFSQSEKFSRTKQPLFWGILSSYLQLN